MPSNSKRKHSHRHGGGSSGRKGSHHNNNNNNNSNATSNHRNHHNHDYHHNQQLIDSTTSSDSTDFLHTESDETTSTAVNIVHHAGSNQSTSFSSFLNGIFTSSTSSQQQNQNIQFLLLIIFFTLLIILVVLLSFVGFYFGWIGAGAVSSSTQLRPQQQQTLQQDVDVLWLTNTSPTYKVITTTTRGSNTTPSFSLKDMTSYQYYLRAYEQNTTAAVHSLPPNALVLGRIWTHEKQVAADSSLSVKSNNHYDGTDNEQQQHRLKLYSVVEHGNFGRRRQEQHDDFLDASGGSSTGQSTRPTSIDHESSSSTPNEPYYTRWYSKCAFQDVDDSDYFDGDEYHDGMEDEEDDDDDALFGIDNFAALERVIQYVNRESADRFVRWNEFFAVLEAKSATPVAFQDDELYYEIPSYITICPYTTLFFTHTLAVNAEHVVLECHSCRLVAAPRRGGGLISLGSTTTTSTSNGGSSSSSLSSPAAMPHFSFGSHAKNVIMRGIVFTSPLSSSSTSGSLLGSSTITTSGRGNQQKKLKQQTNRFNKNNNNNKQQNQRISSSSVTFFQDGADSRFEDCRWSKGSVADVNSASSVAFVRCFIQPHADLNRDFERVVREEQKRQRKQQQQKQRKKKMDITSILPRWAIAWMQASLVAVLQSSNKLK